MNITLNYLFAALPVQSWEGLFLLPAISIHVTILLSKQNLHEGGCGMDIQEKAKIIALAKLLGCTLPNSEVLDKYSQYFQESLEEIRKITKLSTATIGSRSKLGI